MVIVGFGIWSCYTYHMVKSMVFVIEQPWLNSCICKSDGRRIECFTCDDIMSRSSQSEPLMFSVATAQEHGRDQTCTENFVALKALISLVSVSSRRNRNLISDMPAKLPSCQTNQSSLPRVSRPGLQTPASAEGASTRMEHSSQSAQLSFSRPERRTSFYAYVGSR
jgi:hypothetical protein